VYSRWVRAREWDRFVARAVARNCAGVECLSGIPGIVGGTPVQNVGAYGQEVAESIDSVLVFDLTDGQIRELCATACGFHYRTKHFQYQRARTIHHPACHLCSDFGGVSLASSIRTEKTFCRLPVDSVINQHPGSGTPHTRQQAMLITPGDEDCRSAGSFFKNPVLTARPIRGTHPARHSQGFAGPQLSRARYPEEDSRRWLGEVLGFQQRLITADESESHANTLSPS